ncbi:thiol reductant ABC exporter subunit CydC [Chryseomicrobium sp. FSL W7-1435]|uniref:thiol reductant ABC exporter subunit CydC n=1 Tax=Chryseomicrobium sp. FSL W7-1435 TaxID=2921704 RepID=UPI00315A7CEE
MKMLLQLILEERKDALIAISLGAVSGITAIALFAQSGYMISKAALAPPFYTILILTAFLKLFGAVKSTSKYFERLISHQVTFGALSRIRQHFFAQLDPLVPQLFTRFRSGELLTRFVGDVEVLQNFFLRVLYPPLVTAVVFMATIFFTLFFSIWMALVLVVGFLLIAVVVPALFAGRLRQNNVLEKRAAVATDAAEYLAGFRELKLHNQLAVKNQQLKETQQLYVAEQLQAAKTQLWSQTVNATVASFTALVILAIGAYFVSIGELNGLFLAMLTLVALTSFDTAVPIAGLPGHLHESRQAMSRLNDVVAPEQLAGNNSLTLSATYEIELSDLSYSYPGIDRYSVNQTSLNFPSGSRTAIVGASGSGKSSLLHLIAGMVLPSAGEVRVNGQSTHNVIPETLWQQLGIQLQSSHFFYGTIRDNLLIAKPGATDEELQLALQKAQLTISLDANVFEKGENLSGGEKQRLSLARLFLKQVPIYLLDEPFTSLDYETEERLAEALWQHTKDSTVILISHKLSDLERMDSIVVMDHGRVVEKGTYQELLAKRGVFHEMKTIEDSIV